MLISYVPGSLRPTLGELQGCLVGLNLVEASANVVALSGAHKTRGQRT